MEVMSYIWKEGIVPNLRSAAIVARVIQQKIVDKKPMAKLKAKSQPTKPGGRGKGKGKDGRKTRRRRKGNKFPGVDSLLLVVGVFVFYCCFFLDQSVRSSYQPLHNCHSYYDERSIDKKKELMGKKNTMTKNMMTKMKRKTWVRITQN